MGRRCCAIPSILDADIRTYLEAENDYTESLLGHTGALQKKLVAEMRGRIKEDDVQRAGAGRSVRPICGKFRDGRATRTVRPATARDGGDVKIVLDGDQLAAGHKYFRFGGARHSPDHGPAGLERRYQRFGIFFDPRARLGNRQRS